MLLQTNSYIVPKDRRAEHTRLLRRFRQTLNRLGCELFEVYEQMGAGWSTGEMTGRFVQIMRFNDRAHQRAVHAAEQIDPAAQQLIADFCELINLPYQQQQGLLAIGYYKSVVDPAFQRVEVEAPPEDAVDEQSLEDEAAGEALAAEQAAEYAPADIPEYESELAEPVNLDEPTDEDAEAIIEAEIEAAAEVESSELESEAPEYASTEEGAEGAALGEEVVVAQLAADGELPPELEGMPVEEVTAELVEVEIEEAQAVERTKEAEAQAEAETADIQDAEIAETIAAEPVAEAEPSNENEWATEALEEGAADAEPAPAPVDESPTEEGALFDFDLPELAEDDAETGALMPEGAVDEQVESSSESAEGGEGAALASEQSISDDASLDAFLAEQAATSDDAIEPRANLHELETPPVAGTESAELETDDGLEFTDAPAIETGELSAAEQAEIVEPQAELQTQGDDGSEEPAEWAPAESVLDSEASEAIETDGATDAPIEASTATDAGESSDLWDGLLDESESATAAKQAPNEDADTDVDAAMADGSEAQHEVEATEAAGVGINGLPTRLMADEGEIEIVFETTPSDLLEDMPDGQAVGDDEIEAALSEALGEDETVGASRR